MKTTHKLAVIGILLLCVSRGIAAESKTEFLRETRFPSLEDFINCAERFKPAQEKGDMGYLFSLPDFGQPEDEKTGRIVLAETIAFAEVIWKTDEYAAVFITANLKTEATCSIVGVLVVLSKTGKVWRIVDLTKIKAYGVECELDCKQTANAHQPDMVGKEGAPAVFILTRTQGGKGYSYTAAFTFKLEGRKLVRLEED